MSLLVVFQLLGYTLSQAQGVPKVVQMVLFLRIVCKVTTTKEKRLGEPAENVGLRRGFVVLAVTDARVRCALDCRKRENIFPFPLICASFAALKRKRFPLDATP
jgi:hypothetical protein